MENVLKSLPEKESSLSDPCDIDTVAGMAEWLGHLTLVRRVPGWKPPSDMCEERISLCNSRQKASPGKSLLCSTKGNIR